MNSAFAHVEDFFFCQSCLGIFGPSQKGKKETNATIVSLNASALLNNIDHMNPR